LSLPALSVAQLLAAFRSSDPTPGGGSASALAGAIGASLLVMVASLPKSRAATEEDARRLERAGEECAALAVDLEALVDRDSFAYDVVMLAYKKPKATDEERAARSAAIQIALRGAIDAPLGVILACAAAAEHGEVIAVLGNPSASSDVKVGFELLGAGLRGAKANVEINLGSVKDPEYVARVRDDVKALESRFSRSQRVV
jgi:formiminotetrahydrofolate cyclodeaminase